MMYIQVKIRRNAFIRVPGKERYCQEYQEYQEYQDHRAAKRIDIASSMDSNEITSSPPS